MPHDHAASKTGGKSAGSSPRAAASPSRSARAQAVLRLQNAAGNRAVAGMLRDRAASASVQRTTLDVVSVQRDDEFLEALKDASGRDQALNLKEFAEALVRMTKQSGGGQAVVPKATPVPEKAEETVTKTAEGGTITATKTVTPAVTEKVPTNAELSRRHRLLKGLLTPKERKEKEDLERREAKNKQLNELEEEQKLAKRETELTRPETREEVRARAFKARSEKMDLAESEKQKRQLLTPEELANRDKKADLSALDKAQTEKESLRLRERKLNSGPSADEAENKAKKAQLDNRDTQQKIAELKRKLGGKLTPEEQQAQDLQDEMEDLEKQQADAEAMRKHMRQVNKPLNPKGQNLGLLLGGRKL